MEIFTQIIFWVAVAYGGACLFALTCSKPMIFPAPAANYNEKLSGLIRIPLNDESSICACFLKSDNPDSDYTILYSHGNAEDIGTQLQLIKEYNKHGWNVLIYDYPGYGLSDGSASEQAVYDSIHAAYNYLLNDCNVPANKIVAYGRSLGGGPTIELASKQEVAGVILECTYITIFRVMTRIALLPWDLFRNIDKIQDISKPLIIFHGTSDIVVPFSHGKALYEKATDPKKNVWINGGGHNNLIELMGKKYWDELEDFKNKLS